MARYVLNDDEKNQVAALADDYLDRHPVWEPLEQADAIRIEAERLPVGVRQFLVTARGAEDALIRVANLPVDDALVPTPASWEIARKEGAAVREELVLLLISSVLGDPFAWTHQQGGRLVHDVCPAKGQENSLTSASSEQQLTLHTEDVFHACRGDYVALMCLRNPDGVGTTVSTLDAVDFAEPLRRVLQEDRFRFFPDDSHHVVPTHTAERPSALEERPFEVASVLFGPADSPYLRIDADFTDSVPEDTEARRSLEAAAGLLARAADRVVLSPGEAVFIDNYLTVHGRDTFTPRYDGTDRWLKRTSVARDLRRAYVHTKSRSRLLA
ncbi:TauD/TfdA family dioxygenase [Kitasatospora sp. NPDC089797]|uniref:TauD/TfdA family dioxygenase n=1 Tax=Kitasatospora sp. NPDC089797 TaxID=3155298 RepID=UPI003438DB32